MKMIIGYLYLGHMGLERTRIGHLKWPLQAYTEPLCPKLRVLNACRPTWFKFDKIGFIYLILVTIVCGSCVEITAFLSFTPHKTLQDAICRRWFGGPWPPVTRRAESTLPAISHAERVIRIWPKPYYFRERTSQSSRFWPFGYYDN